MTAAGRAEPIFAPKPVVIGHRGLGNGTVHGHVENTLDSCLAAVSAGATWIEVDARRSADAELVVHHNPSTPDGAFVVDRTAAEAEDTGLSRLTDILATVPASVGVNVDVKTELEDAVCPADQRTCALLAPVLAAEAGRRPLFVSSFDPAALLYLTRRVPGLPAGLLTWVNFPLRHAVPAAVHLGFPAVALHVGSFGPNAVEKRPEVHRTPEYSVQVAHQAGLEVLAWCPDAQWARRLATAGVDAVCVNDIPATLDALENS